MKIKRLRFLVIAIFKGHYQTVNPPRSPPPTPPTPENTCARVSFLIKLQASKIMPIHPHLPLIMSQPPPPTQNNAPSTSTQPK